MGPTEHCGILSIYKPVGPTSADIVGSLKRRLPREFNKIGHFGTLDPFACGLLLIGFNGAARFNEYIHTYCPKTYVAVGRIGTATDTGDHTGQTLKMDEDKAPGEFQKWNCTQWNQYLHKHFLGEYWQTPPDYSSVKVGGKRLHQLARQGLAETVEKQAKKKFIHKIEVVYCRYPYVTFRCTVSSGTYVRQLFIDILKKMDSIGHLVSLVRTGIGNLTLEQKTIHLPRSYSSNTPLSLPQFQEQWGAQVVRPYEVLDFERYHLPEHSFKTYTQGMPVDMSLLLCSPEQKERLLKDALFSWVFCRGELVGLGRVEGAKLAPVVNLIAQH